MTLPTRPKVWIEAYRQSRNNGWIPWCGFTCTRGYDGDTLRAMILTWYCYRAILSLGYVSPSHAVKAENSQ
jgi:hypothetical protein